jgi:two-component system, sensor histidine kinase LadS
MNNVLKNNCCLWFLFSVLSVNACAQPEDYRSFQLTAYATFLVDSSNKLAINEVIRQRQAQFSPLNLVSDHFNTWVKVEIPPNIASGEYCISLWIEETIELYSFDGKKLNVAKNGRFLKPSLRSVPDNFRYLFFKLTDTNKTIYLKIAPLFGHAMPVEINMQPGSVVLDYVEANTRITFVVTGAIFVIILCSLTLYLLLRDSSYLLFAVYVLCSYAMSNTVFLGSILGDAYPLLWLDEHVIQVYYILCPLSLLWFSHAFFQINSRSSLWNRIFVTMMLASLVCFLTIPASAALNSDIILVYNVLVVLLVGLYSGIAYFKQKFKPGGYFLVAFVVPIVVSMVIVLDYLGVLPMPALNLLAGFAFLTQSFILFVGVVTRYQQVNADLHGAMLSKLQKEHEAGIFRMRNTELQSQNKVIEEQRLKLAEQTHKLEELNLTKDKLLTVLAHDLKAPVNNLKAILSLLSSRMMTEEEFHTVSSKLKKDVESVNEMLEDVLHWVKSQHEAIVPRPADFNLKKVADELANLAAPAAVDKHVNIAVNSMEPCTVHADPDQVQIIIRNLLSNAIKFAPPESQVGINIEATDEYVRLTVSDEGAGITNETVQSIMAGKKVHSTRGTQGEKGTGLGLLLCREFIQLNGGEFSLSSGSGKGTQVSFTLPKAS